MYPSILIPTSWSQIVSYLKNANFFVLHDIFNLFLSIFVFPIRRDNVRPSDNPGTDKDLVWT